MANDLEMYKELYEAFNYFNVHLFAGQLPPCQLTLQREKHTYGYHSPNRWVNTVTSEKRDEIAMNPAYFGVRPIKHSLSTLVHEMVHQKQKLVGKSGRRGYHNKEWGKMMIEVGLYPSNTGQKGGKMVGDQMSHYIIEGGPFDRVCDDLLTTEFKLSWADRFPPRDAMPAMPVPVMPVSNLSDPVDIDEPFEPIEPAPYITPLSVGTIEDDVDIVMPLAVDKSNRVTFFCPSCGQKAWGKPSLKIICGVDQEPMIPKEVSEK